MAVKRRRATLLESAAASFTSELERAAMQFSIDVYKATRDFREAVKEDAPSEDTT